MNPIHDPAQLDREDCRRAVLAFFALRPRAAFNVPTVVSLLRGATWPMEDIAAAIGFLKSDGFLDCHPDQFGATPYYQITAAGTRAHERA